MSLCFRVFGYQKESEARKVNFRPHFEFILQHSGLGDQCWRFLEGDNQVFEQNLQDISKEAQLQDSETDACQRVFNSFPEHTSQGKGKCSLERRPPLLKIKSAILSPHFTRQDRVLSILHCWATLLTQASEH